MSTQTSLLKRVAQTAVVALLGGLFATLATAPSANAASNASISASCVARAGVGGVIKVNVNGDDDQEIYATQSAATLSAESSTASVVLDASVLRTQPDSGSTSTGIPLGPDTLTTRYATISYLVWLDNENNGTDTSIPDLTGNGDPTTTVVCTVAKAPASFTLSASSSSISATESATFTITPKDAAGNTTLLAPGESITVSSNFTTALATAGQALTDANGNRTGSYAVGGNLPRAAAGAAFEVKLENSVSAADTCAVGTATSACTLTLGTKNADGIGTGENDNPNITGDSETITGTGAFTVNVTNTAAATTTWTVRGAGTIGMVSATAATYTLTTLDYVYGACFGVGSVAALGTATSTAVAGGGIIASNQVAPANTPDKTGTASSCKTAGASGPATASASYTVSTARKAVTITWGLTAAGTFPVTVAAVSTTSSTPAGITLETVNLNSGTETFVSLTLTATAPVSGQSYKVTWNSAQNTSRTLTLTYADPVVNSSNGSVVLSPTSGKALTGGTVAVEALVRDQFNSLTSGATVLFTVTGRNATTSAVSATTNASGVASYSFVDDGVPATTLSDTVAATAQTAGTTSAISATSRTFTWTASLTVTTLRLVNDADSAGVAIDGDVLFTATALDASGLPLSGYPVTFTADDKSYTGATGNSSTVAYTGDNGVATATFDGRLVGTSTITASSGGKTATSSYTVLAGTARTITVDAATASMAAGASKRVTATVKDRYGNGIEDAAVTVSYTGTVGRVASVNGIASASGTADADGKVVIEVASDAGTGAGTGTLTVKFTGGNTSTAALNPNGSAQPARVTSATSAITVTAADSSVQTAADAAADAAAEAIDAANAATDAANLAAEAADAATVAAEEARDAADAATAAVEELATQVATLMAALKAQITTLANTVAKIAKKVRA